MSQPKRPTGLGRGLSALLEEMGSAVAPPRSEPGTAPAVPAGDAGSSMGAQMLPMAMISPNPKQPRRRFDETAQAELIASVKRQGLLQPILVRPVDGGRFEIVAGERRWRAAQAAQLHDVPVLVRRLTDEEAFEVALVENVQRQDLNAIEEAEGYKRLIDDYGHTQEDIARIVGKSRSHVANMMRLLALPELALEALDKGAITAGHARALLTAPTPEIALAAVLKKNLSVRDTELLVRGMQALDKRGELDGLCKPQGAPKPSVSGKKDADTRALEADLAAALGLEVEIDHSPKGAGAVTIRYLNLDQLDDIVRRLTGAAV